MKKMLTAVLLVLVSIGASVAQTEQMPQDKNVRIGQLFNGMTYYIKHNEQPKNRCDFHIAQAVGSILEEDNQNGLAHFLEHMAFNGTQHFPGKGIINYFESIGVNFGGDINAYTSLDQTVYRLSNVPCVTEGPVDSALLVLHDWSHSLLLTAEEIDAERGVIREEWRSGADAQRRMWKETNALRYPGSQYAKRDVIGDTAVINNFTYDALRSYYHKWYGPDLQCLVIVGDIDVDVMEQKIIKLFSAIPERENRGERPIYTVNDNVEPIIAIAKDKELPLTQIRVDYKHNPLPSTVVRSVQGLQFDVVTTLAAIMTYNRFNELTQDPNANLVRGGAFYGNMVKSKDAFTFYASPKAGRSMEAFADLMTEIERIKRFGYTNSELERAKADYLAWMESSYKERNNRQNQAVAESFVDNYLNGEVTIDEEWRFNFLKQVLPVLNVKNVNQLIAQLIIDKNQIVTFTIPEKEGFATPSKLDVLDIMRKAKAQEIEAPKEDKIDANLFDETPKAGSIKKENFNLALNTTEFELSNGIRVIVKPTEYKEDEILMNAYSKGGYSLVKNPKDLRALCMTDAIIQQNGIGKFSAIDLTKVLAGKNVNVTPSISDESEGMEGVATVKDFETMLQLMNLYFTSPRRDDNAFKSMMAQYETVLANADANPRRAFSDSISMMQSNHSPRTILVNADLLKDIDQAQSIAFYKQRFANPADFIITFTGNIDPKDPATRQMICTWLGSLKTKKSRWSKEKVKDTKVRRPLGKVTNKFARKMTTNTASNRIELSGSMDYTLQNRVAMRFIGEILSTRYLESIREKEGGSYGVGTYGYITKYPVSQAVLLIQFNTDPEKQDKLMSIIYKEIKTIMANGPIESDMAKTKQILIKSATDDFETNDFWNSTVLYRYYVDGVDYKAEYLKALENITAEDVQNTLKALYNQGNIMEVTMMPEMEK